MPADDLIGLSDSSTATKPRRFGAASSRAPSYMGAEKAIVRPAGTRPRVYDPQQPAVGGADLVPEMLELLPSTSTLEDDA